MAIIVHFSPSGLDKSKYDDAIRRLEQAGAGSPPGRLYHCFYDSGGALKVVEVWDSQQSFERFGQTLMPILKSDWHRRWAARGQSGAQRDLRPIGTPAGVATARACAWLEGWGGSKDPCRALVESCSVSREYRRLDHDAEPRDEPDAQTAALRLPFVRRLSQTFGGQN